MERNGTGEESGSLKKCPAKRTLLTINLPRSFGIRPSAVSNQLGLPECSLGI